MTNRTILHGLKTRLNQTKGLWADELYGVLWSYRTIPRISTEETSFNLAFEIEAVIPVEISLPSMRIEHYDEAMNVD